MQIAEECWRHTTNSGPATGANLVRVPSPSPTPATSGNDDRSDDEETLEYVGALMDSGDYFLQAGGGDPRSVLDAGLFKRAADAMDR